MQTLRAPECGAFLGIFLSICILCLCNKVILIIAATGPKSQNIISLARSTLAAVCARVCVDKNILKLDAIQRLFLLRNGRKSWSKL